MSAASGGKGRELPVKPRAAAGVGQRKLGNPSCPKYPAEPRPPGETCRDRAVRRPGPHRMLHVRFFAHDRPSRAIASALLLALVAAGCKSAESQRASADRQVYSLIEERRAALGSTDRPFTIEPDPDSMRRKLERGEIAGLESLTLVQALELAAENSRDFQDQREAFFLDALDLTLERYRFEFQTTGTLVAFLSGDGDGATTA